MPARAPPDNCLLRTADHGWGTPREQPRIIEFDRLQSVHRMWLGPNVTRLD